MNILDISFILDHLMPHFSAESQGEIEVKDPCACESLVEFQQVTMSTLDQLNQKHILYIFISIDPLNSMLSFQHMQLHHAALQRNSSRLQTFSGITWGLTHYYNKLRHLTEAPLYRKSPYCVCWSDLLQTGPSGLAPHINLCDHMLQWLFVSDLSLSIIHQSSKEPLYRVWGQKQMFLNY